MIERLSISQVIEYNKQLCADSGEIPAVLDAEGLEAALERPWSGLAEEEFFPSIYDKAAALLHGIASRQVFENGNKRTAWAAAAAFLDVNGYDIGQVKTVQADMFVRAAALDHSLEIGDLAGWFEDAVENKRPGYTTDPRLEYLFLAGAKLNDGDGTLTIADGHLHTLAVRNLPMPFQVTLLTRIHWRQCDLDARHYFSVEIETEGRPVLRRRRGGTYGMDLLAPVAAGPAHDHIDSGLMPVIFWFELSLTAVREGRVWLRAFINDELVGRVPLTITAMPPEVPDTVPDWAPAE